jgi:2,3-bisphosphoglycerate-independent phosphoglycerate mutase
MKKRNVTNRRKVALENLKKQEFFPKKMKDGKERSEEKWTERKTKMIEVLEKRIGSGVL